MCYLRNFVLRENLEVNLFYIPQKELQNICKINTNNKYVTELVYIYERKTVKCMLEVWRLMAIRKINVFKI